MRASPFHISIVALFPLSLAAPINPVQRDLSGFFDGVRHGAANAAGEKTVSAANLAGDITCVAVSLATGVTAPAASFAGDLTSVATSLATDVIAPAATTAVANGAGQNAALTAARQQVVQGLKDTSNALNKVSAEANSTGNAGVETLVVAAQSGLNAAVGGVANISASIASGATPSKTDQKGVAQGIFSAEAAINSMTNAITTPDQTLSSNIASASTSVESLKAGGLAVLAASNITLTDLGLSADAANNSANN